MAKEEKNPLAPFERHGMVFSDATSGNASADCPFCGKEDHFFVSKVSGKWDCKSCFETGNVVTFLTLMAKVYEEGLDPKDLKRLARIRKLPTKAFEGWGFGFIEGEWMLPIWSATGFVNDIRRYNGDKIMSTDGCDLQLFNQTELVTSQPEQRCWVAEGEWDAIALRWLLDQTIYKSDVVVGLPGAGSMKDKWVDWFKGREVIFCFDNDDPGDRAAKRTAIKLSSAVKKAWFLCWPETLETGYDINNFVSAVWESKKKPIDAVKELLEMVKPQHRHDSEIVTTVDQEEEKDPGTFQEVLDVWSKWVNPMDQDMRDGLTLALAIGISGGMDGEAMWMYVVGAPSSGKNLITTSLDGSDRAVFRSSIKRASLISGFNTHPDPSDLPKFDGRTAVIKEGTTLLEMNEDARHETYAILREAYDGVVQINFANLGLREYRSRFNMLIGITPAIFGVDNSIMGERFLKFYMRSSLVNIEKKLETVMSNPFGLQTKHKELSAAVRRFAHHRPDPTSLPGIPSHYMNKLMNLVQLVALLRAAVQRTYTGETKYRPVSESPMRLGQQFPKLAMLVSFVLGLEEMNADVYRLMRRVAMDTCIGYHVDVVRTMMKHGREGMTFGQLTELAGISLTTIRRIMEDLEALKVVYRIKPQERTREVGTKAFLWFVTDEVASLWNNSLTDAQAVKSRSPHTAAR